MLRILIFHSKQLLIKIIYFNLPEHDSIELSCGIFVYSSTLSTDVMWFSNSANCLITHCIRPASPYDCVIARPTFPPNIPKYDCLKWIEFKNNKKKKLQMFKQHWSLLLLTTKKLNVTMDVLIKHIKSNQSPNDLLVVKNKYHAEECKSCKRTTI